MNYLLASTTQGRKVLTKPKVMKQHGILKDFGLKSGSNKHIKLIYDEKKITIISIYQGVPYLYFILVYFHLETIYKKFSVYHININKNL